MTEKDWIQQSQEVIAHLNLLKEMKQQGVGAAEALPACDAAMEKWGPLAEQLGMSHEQHEMLDLAVELGYPDDFRELKRLLLESEAMCENVFKTFALPIHSLLQDLGIEYSFKYRMKSIYSIWRKMRIAHREFDDVYDLFATRIVYKVKEEVAPIAVPNAIDAVPGVADIKAQTLQQMDLEKLYCWRIYTVISSLYRIHPDRIRDWITYPKPSGYKALQLTVMGPDCNWIEIQIRSERMDYEAEHGAASHFLYKQATKVK
ncbi:MAG: hypothetical protein ACI4C3_05030 [Bacteroides sp.]